MSHLLATFVILSIVALSSSNIVEPNQSQLYDNTYIRNDEGNKIFDTIVCEERDEKCKLLAISDNPITDNNLPEVDVIRDNTINKEENYNGEGFRQEQWHNYPRQLDRLQKFLYERHKIKSDDETVDLNPYGINLKTISDDRNTITDAVNELLLNNRNQENAYDTVITSSDPLLVYKIRLSSLSQPWSDGNVATRNDRSTTDNDQGILERIMEKESNIKELNPETRFEPNQDVLNSKDTDTQPYWQGAVKIKRIDSLRVKKRIFSLWSRLQSMAPRGHELHHRRHLHAFMNLQGAEGGGGALTAEARAVMRPPGSPLRWG